MPATLPSRTVETPLNSVSPRPAKASIECNRPQPSGDSKPDEFDVSLVFDTLAEVGIDDKEAGYWMGKDKATVSRMKHGLQPLPLEAVWRLPDRFWAKFHPRIAEAKGITERHLLKVRKARMLELVSLIVEDMQ